LTNPYDTMAADLYNQDGTFSLSAILKVIGTIAVFAVLIWLFYGKGGQEGEPVVVDPESQPPSAAELRAQEAEILATYGWVNQEAGVVRIPIDRAAELFLEETNP